MGGFGSGTVCLDSAVEGEGDEMLLCGENVARSRKLKLSFACITCVSCLLDG